MERRFAARLEEMLAQAEVPPALLQGTLRRLEEFVRPFAAELTEPEQQRHLGEYVAGLLSKLKRKTGESIAYLHDQQRQGLQKFLGHVPWDHRPLLRLLARQAGAQLGEPDGVIVFDPSGFPKKGTKSVGVAWQWCGRLGKVENCQVGVFMGYASRTDHALVDVRLYLPTEWTKGRARCLAAGVPRATKFRTRHELALEMLQAAHAVLPHAWIAGDDEMGRSSRFRRELRERTECYLLAVPSNTLIRDLDAPPPEYAGRGRPPKTKFARVDRWRSAVAETAWIKIDVRDGEKGPLVVEAVACRVQAWTDKGGPGPDEVLVVLRERQSDGTYKHDYYLSNADPNTRHSEFARVAKAAHRIEECLKRGKNAAGLGDYQVRNWIAWHHHQTLSLLAAWFLSQETRRGKNPDAGSDGRTSERHDRQPAGRTPTLQQPCGRQPPQYPLAGAQRASPVLSSSRTQGAAPIEEPPQVVGIQ